jgi:hypothetical protein
MLRHLITQLHYPKTGKGQQVSIFPWISTDFTNFTSPELLQTPGQLTTVWYDDFGNSFTLRKVGIGGWAQGDVTTWSGTTGQTTNSPFFADTVASATVRVITTTAVAYTPSGEAAGPANNYGSWVFDDTLVAVPNDRLKLIKANSASTLTVANIDTRVSNLQNDADAYTTAPAAADAITVIRPYVAVKFPIANATTALPTGISVQAGTAGNWGFVQVDGLAMVSCAGNATAIVAGGPIVPDGVTAGFGKGAAAVAANMIGTSAAAHTAATGLCPVFLAILGYA